MNNLYKYKTKCGLDVLYYYKKDFYKSYCGIGTKFGSANLKYEIDNQIYNITDGVAHFIEHKLFQMPNNIDAYQEFDKLNCEANAYTTHDKTVYFFNTVENIKKQLLGLSNSSDNSFVYSLYEAVVNNKEDEKDGKIHAKKQI